MELRRRWTWLALDAAALNDLYEEAKAAKQRGDTPLAIELLFTAIQIDSTMGPEFSSRGTSRRAGNDLQKWAFSSAKATEKSIAIFERVNRRLGLSLDLDSESEGGDDLFEPGSDDTEEEVVFLRPDGTTESKTIAWCLSNDFFEVQPGL